LLPSIAHFHYLFKASRGCVQLAVTDQPPVSQRQAAAGTVLRGTFVPTDRRALSRQSAAPPTGSVHLDHRIPKWLSLVITQVRNSNCTWCISLERLVSMSLIVSGGSTTRAAERKCEPGFFCQQGVKFHCRPGTWGGEYGLSTSSCSGNCAPGYYCPLGSIAATEKFCGDPSRYCPGGSAVPLPVSIGFYSIGNELLRWIMHVL